jgi:hypothetical protein
MLIELAVDDVMAALIEQHGPVVPAPNISASRMAIGWRCRPPSAAPFHRLARAST